MYLLLLPRCELLASVYVACISPVRHSLCGHLHSALYAWVMESHACIYLSSIFVCIATDCVHVAIRILIFLSAWPTCEIVIVPLLTLHIAFDDGV